MKISQKSDIAAYVKDIAAVLEDHQSCCVMSKNNGMMVIVPKLNLIATENIGFNLVWELFSEYRRQKDRKKKFLITFYTVAILIIIKLKLPIFKKIKINYDDQYPAILGGNNRIRLISACNQYALVHAINNKTKWSCDAVIHAIQYYSKCGCIALPQVMSLSCGGYLEQQIKGIAINRLTFQEKGKIDFTLTKSLNGYFDFQILSGFKLSVDEYFKCKYQYVIEKSTDENLVCDEEMKFIVSLKDKINLFTEADTIDCVYSHGDLNTGNIFISKDHKVFIIDWEYFGVRNLNYDRFVYSTNLRHTNSNDEYRNIIESPKASFLDILEEYIFCVVNGKRGVEVDGLKLKHCRSALARKLRD